MVMIKITREDQLKNPANFVTADGKIGLVRCMACPDAGDRGIENYAIGVMSGQCSWCGWRDEDQEKEVLQET